MAPGRTPKQLQSACGRHRCCRRPLVAKPPGFEQFVVVLRCSTLALPGHGIGSTESHSCRSAPVDLYDQYCFKYCRYPTGCGPLHVRLEIAVQCRRGGINRVAAGGTWHKKPSKTKLGPTLPSRSTSPATGGVDSEAQRIASFTSEGDLQCQIQ